MTARRILRRAVSVRAVASLNCCSTGKHGLSVSQHAMDPQLVVSELVTNAHKCAPGPVLLDLRITGYTVEVVVWDSDPTLPIAWAADGTRADRVRRWSALWPGAQ